MTSAALEDLSTRIASNTLTAVQQAALVGALALMAPDFPGPDEIANSIVDERLARRWIAPLYTLQAVFSGGGTVLPTQESAWFINAATGDDANSGTSADAPLRTVQQLGLRWRGVFGGGRPILSPATGTTITVTLQTTIPAIDSLAAILDVDLASPGGTPVTLIIVGGAGTTAHTGAINTATAFARTNAGGQIKVTDVTVADFAPLVGAASLFVDTTSGAVAWLYGPDAGSSATGTLTIGYSAQSPGTPPAQTQTAIAGADAYRLAPLLGASLGEGFVTRSFPLKSTSNSGTESSVFFYRLNLTQPNVNDGFTLQSPTVTYVFQECQIPVQATAIAGSVIYANTFFFHSLGIRSVASAVVDCVDGGGISGQNSGSVTADAGGVVLVDTDFMLFSAAAVHRDPGRGAHHRQRVLLGAGRGQPRLRRRRRRPDHVYAPRQRHRLLRRGRRHAHRHLGQPRQRLDPLPQRFERDAGGPPVPVQPLDLPARRSDERVWLQRDDGRDDGADDQHPRASGRGARRRDRVRRASDRPGDRELHAPRGVGRHHGRHQREEDQRAAAARRRGRDRARADRRRARAPAGAQRPRGAVPPRHAAAAPARRLGARAPIDGADAGGPDPGGPAAAEPDAAQVNRPRIDLDPIARALDRMIEHPLMRLVEEAAPELVAGARELRDKLPDVAAGLERRAVEHVTREARELAGEMGRELRRAVAGAVRKGRAGPRRLPAKKSKRRSAP